MKTVAILGSKGGIGKTSLAHCLAYGASLHGEAAAMVHTDQRRPVRGERPYRMIDASGNYARVAELVREGEGRPGLLVVDGAGNRPHVDLWITRIADLVLVPVTNSSEDVRCALEDLARLNDSRVRVLVNRWPANVLVRAVMARYVERLPKRRVVGYLNDVGAVRLFLDDGTWRTPPTRVNNLARWFHRLVAAELERRQDADLLSAAGEVPAAEVAGA